MREAEEYTKLRRRKDEKGKLTGAHVYISYEVLCKALKHSNIDCDNPNLKCKITACKDGKRAKIILNIKA